MMLRNCHPRIANDEIKVVVTLEISRGWLCVAMLGEIEREDLGAIIGLYVGEESLDDKFC